MKQSVTVSGGSGIRFGGALTIAFIVLKLCGVIDWSWWWVISPIWISALLIITLFIINVTIHLHD